MKLAHQHVWKTSELGRWWSTSAQILGGALLSIAIVAIGTVALITAMIGFLIALGASYDESQTRTVTKRKQYTDDVDADGQFVND